MVLGVVAALAQTTSPVQYFYDDLGRLTKVVDQTGNSATYHYDAVGNLLSITRTTVPANNALAVLSFSAQKGAAGAVATIQGLGFSTTSSADAVQFNGTPAVVTAATAGALTVTVPTGASTLRGLREHAARVVGIAWGPGFRGVGVPPAPRNCAHHLRFLTCGRKNQIHW
jgi:YD repeat-containing protein